MDRGDDERQERHEPERAGITEQRPILPDRGDLERWNKLPATERFQQPDYQRWAQSFRSRESLSEAGRKGYETTVRRYGKEFMYDRAADKRREPELPKSRTEREVLRMLEELGLKQDRSDHGGQAGDYRREHKLAPMRHADFAWPEQSKAIEAWGGVHTARFFVEQERVREENRRQVERAQAAGWEVMILRDEDLAPDRWEETRERVRRFLG